MTPTEHHAKSASAQKIGRFATLRGLLHTKGSGAPKIRSRGLLLSLLATTFGVSLFAAAPALAAEQYVFSSSFGSVSYGLAVNQSTGQVYAATGGSVDVFEASGAPASTPQLLNAAGTEPYRFAFAFAVAADNSTQSSKGDVYVADLVAGAVDQFDAAGAATSIRITEASIPLIDQGNGFEPRGVAVSSSGDLFVTNYANGVVDEFSSSGVFIAQIGSAAEINSPEELAIDGANDLYVVGGGGVVEFNSSGTCVNSCTPVIASAHVGIAVNGAGDLFVGEGSRVGEYDASGTWLRYFGGKSTQPPFAGLGNAAGLAVNNTSHGVYVADEAGIVDLFLIPPIETEPAFPAEETSATLHGSVDPEGQTLSECKFEYGTEESYGQSIPCEHIPTGTSFIPVSAPLSTLTPRTTYHYRLVINGPKGVVDGFDQSFYTASRPGIEPASEPSTNTGSSSTTLHANVDPYDSPTSYFFEYGPTTAYGSRTPVASAGGGIEAVDVLASLEGLTPETTYHFRLVAENEVSRKLGSPTLGPDGTFSTFPPGLLGLPDERSYELVSSSDNPDFTVISGGYPVRAAADGSAVTYLGTPPTVGGNGRTGGLGNIEGNQYRATRSGTGGWTATDIQPNGLLTPEYTSFSNDLSVGIVNSHEPVTADAPENGYDGLYSWSASNGGYTPLFTAAPAASNFAYPALFYAPFEGMSADLSHRLFTANGGLTAQAPTERELYDSVDGQVYLVSILPNGQPDTNETVAGSASGDRERVVSNDGSRIFWTDKATGDLYVRENEGTPEAHTVMIAEDGKFWGASSDGSRVIFTDEKQLTSDSTAAAGAPDLYQYDVQDGDMRDLSIDPHSGEHANVVGVLGSSEDGSYVYFAASGALANGATFQECSPGKCNVYVVHESEAPKLVATVTYIDGEGGTTASQPGNGDWVPGVGSRLAQVTGDGRHLIFESVEDLNRFNTQEAREIYMYDFGGGLSCVSCNPSGTSSIIGANTGQQYYVAHSELRTSDNATYMLRDVSADGDRVFFDSQEALVPQDTNGLTDVYEWEAPGEGSCTADSASYSSVNDGCLYDLSGGTSSEISVFDDASETGNDVFISTRADLVPQDKGDAYEVYDVRVGAPLEPAPPACTGSGCQGVPGAPPIFATPSSVTFNGVGNFPPPVPVKKITKKTVKCAKGKKLSHGKCVKQKKPKKSTHRKGSK